MIGKSLACSLFGILTVVVPAVPGEVAEQQAPPPKAASGPAPAAAIPLAEIATRAAEVLNLLPALTVQLAPPVEIQAILSRLPEVSERIDVDLAATGQLLQGQPSLEIIAAQQEQWKARQTHTTEWLSVLTRRATQLQATLDRLAAMQATWGETRAAAQAANAPVAILQQIEAVLAAIESTETPFQAQRATLLELQGRVAHEVARCGTALVLFAEAEQRAMGGILARDAPPIWSAELWAQARATLPARIRHLTATQWADLSQYVRDSSRGMPLHLAAFAVLTLLLCAARRRIRRWTAAGEEVSSATTVFGRPYAAALMVPLLYLASPYTGVPPTVRHLSNVFGLVPVLRLIRPVTDPRLVSGLYALALLFTLNTIRQAYAGAPGIDQALLSLAVLAGMVFLGYALTIGPLRRPSTKGTETGRLCTLRLGARLVLLIFAVALVAGLLGYMRLARLLASGVIASSTLALALYATFRVLNGVTVFVLRVWPLRLLQMVQRHRNLLERRVQVALRWMAIVAWASRTLDYVGLLQPVMGLGSAVLAARLQRGSMSISLGDVLDFALTVGLAFLLSMFLRFALQEDVYPRIGLTRGVSYAFSSLLNYLIVTIGFLLGLAALGMDLTKVTILAGALGVGIGFGLQDVVNNFVSGLILLFERPIHVGDSVEVGSLAGTVSRIGIRASTVRTGQGAELIVPNAKLVTEQMTNWTLSDRLRRIDLPVGVNYGSPPQKVIEVLEAVACAHPDVLRHPAPQAFFTGFGDSSINFELRAWTEHFDRWFQVKSELAVAVHDAVLAAGMSFPFPQREIRLVRDASSAEETFEPPRQGH